MRLLCLFLLLPFNLFGQISDPHPANRLILDEAVRCIGKQIGNGTCDEYVTHCLALTDSYFLKGKPAVVNRGFILYRAKYYFGRALEIGESPLPGDVILFHGWHVWDNEESFRESPYYHVGIIHKILSKEDYLVLSQEKDLGENQTVVEFMFSLRDGNCREYMIFRPKYNMLKKV